MKGAHPGALYARGKVSKKLFLDPYSRELSSRVSGVAMFRPSAYLLQHLLLRRLLLQRLLLQAPEWHTEPLGATFCANLEELTLVNMDCEKKIDLLFGELEEAADV